MGALKSCRAVFGWKGCWFKYGKPLHCFSLNSSSPRTKTQTVCFCSVIQNTFAHNVFTFHTSGCKYCIIASRWEAGKQSLTALDSHLHSTPVTSCPSVCAAVPIISHNTMCLFTPTCSKLYSLLVRRVWVWPSGVLSTLKFIFIVELLRNWSLYISTHQKHIKPPRCSSNSGKPPKWSFHWKVLTCTSNCDRPCEERGWLVLR